MRDKKLVYKLRRAYTKLNKGFKDPAIYEISNTDGVPAKAGENKILTDTFFGRFSGTPQVWLLLSLCPLLKANWWIGAIGAVLSGWPNGFKKAFDIAFKKHRIEISDSGICIENELITWAEVTGVFVITRRERYSDEKFIGIGLNDGTFKFYNLVHYTRLKINIQDELSQYIAPHLPMNE